MANHSAARIVRTLARLSAIQLLFCLAAPAYADPIKYALVNAVFDDGGLATGYVVYEAPPAPASPRVTDWAIEVRPGTTGIPRFWYDPTSSTVSFTPDLMTFVAPPNPFSPCTRRIQFDLLQFGALAGETCQVTRQFVSGEFQQQPGPVLTLKVGNQHPASRVVFGGGSALLKLDISPAGVTTPLDWYFAIVFEQGTVWLSPGGASATPVPLVHAAPALVFDQTVLFVPLNGNTQTTFAIIATDGSSVFAFDYMRVIVPPSP